MVQETPCAPVGGLRWGERGSVCSACGASFSASAEHVMRPYRDGCIMNVSLRCSLILATLTVVCGCGNDDSGPSPASCHKYCEKRAPANCGLALDYDNCIEMSCAVYDSDVSTACKKLWERFHSCMLEVPDICASGDCGGTPALDPACAPSGG